MPDVTLRVVLTTCDDLRLIYGLCQHGGGVFRIPKTHIDGSLEIPKDPFNCLKSCVFCLFFRMMYETSGINDTLGEFLVPEATLTKCHTMPEEPVLTCKVLSSDDRHDVDVLGQQSLSVGGHTLLL
ncbi:hypothetical protein Tco_0909621 [Tanacetum coccineum]|uniref:Uncharacterized protein n=1 Tax=Tanacetum coccineum TaxID=301880 RepID=A0ABQ5CQH5_9ASTR